MLRIARNARPTAADKLREACAIADKACPLAPTTLDVPEAPTLGLFAVGPARMLRVDGRGAQAIMVDRFGRLEDAPSYFAHVETVRLLAWWQRLADAAGIDAADELEVIGADDVFYLSIVPGACGEYELRARSPWRVSECAFSGWSDLVARMERAGINVAYLAGVATLEDSRRHAIAAAAR